MARSARRAATADATRCDSGAPAARSARAGEAWARAGNSVDCGRGRWRRARRTRSARTPVAGSRTGRPGRARRARAVSSSAHARLDALRAPHRTVGAPHLDGERCPRLEAEGAQPAAGPGGQAVEDRLQARADPCAGRGGRPLPGSRTEARRPRRAPRPRPRAACCRRCGGRRPTTRLERDRLGACDVARASAAPPSRARTRGAAAGRAGSRGAGGRGTTPRSRAARRAGRAAAPSDDATRAASRDEARPSEASRPEPALDLVLDGFGRGHGATAPRPPPA